jgi:hypothetical protein
MLSSSTTAVSHRDAVEPVPADHASLHPRRGGGGVAAATGAGGAPSTVSASPAPVLITEQQVIFATAAAGAASRIAATRRPWIVLIRQRLSAWSSTLREPRRSYPRLRSSYIEYAAMAREMERL